MMQIGESDSKVHSKITKEMDMDMNIIQMEPFMLGIILMIFLMEKEYFIGQME